MKFISENVPFLKYCNTAYWMCEFARRTLLTPDTIYILLKVSYFANLPIHIRGPSPKGKYT